MLKDKFISYVKGEFPGALDTHFAWNLMDNLIEYGIKNKNYSKGQLATFLDEMIPEVSVEEIERFIEVDAFAIEETKFDIVEYAGRTATADETLKRILAKDYYNFDQYAEVSTITDLEVAKIIIKRLLDKVQ